MGSVWRIRIGTASIVCEIHSQIDPCRRPSKASGATADVQSHHSLDRDIFGASTAIVLDMAQESAGDLHVTRKLVLSGLKSRQSAPKQQHQGYQDNGERWGDWSAASVIETLLKSEMRGTSKDRRPESSSASLSVE